MSTRFPISEATFLLTADQAGLTRGLADAQRVVEQRAREIGNNIERRIGDAATRTGKSLSLALTAPIIAAGTIFARMGIQVDNAFSIIRRQTGATGRELDALRDDFRDVFRGADESAEQVATVLSDLNTRLRLTGMALRSATTAMLDFADVNRTDAAEATREVSRLLNAMGLSAAQVPMVLDKLTAAAQRTGISANQLAALVTTAGPAFQALGFDLDQTIALLAQLERAGAEPAQAVQGMNVLFRQFAKGGVRDAEAAFNGFLEAIKNAPDLVRATGIATEIFGRQALPLARAIRSGAFEVSGLSASLRTSQGVLRAAAAESETFGEKFARMGNAMSVALAPLGAAILDVFERNLPTIERFIDALTGLTQAFAALPPGVQSSAVAAVALLAALGPALLLVGQLAKAWVALKAAFTAIAGVAGTVAAVLSGPVALAVLGVVAVIVGLAAAWSRNWLGIREAIEGAAPAIIRILRSILPPLALLLRGMELVAAAVRRVRGEAAQTRFPGDTFRKRTVEEERRGGLAPTVPGGAPRVIPFEGLGGGGGGAAQNRALQQALQMFDFIRERDRLTTAQQIASLERIRDAHAKTADERMGLEVRLSQLRDRLADEVAEKSRQSLDESLRFIQERLVAGGAAFGEIDAAFQRVIQRVASATAAEFGTEEARLAALRRLIVEHQRFRLTSEKEAADRIAQLRRELTVEMERLTLDEFEFERREINRRFDERRKEVQHRVRLAKDAAVALAEVERGREAALADLGRRARESQLRQAVEVVNAQRAIGQATTEHAIAARQALLGVMIPGSLEYLRLWREIEDLKGERAQQQAAQAQRFVEFVDLQRQLGQATIQDTINARQALLALTSDELERLRILQEILALQRQLGSEDPFIGLKLALDDLMERTFDWRDAWTQAIQGIEGGIASMLGAIRRGEANLLQNLQNILDAALSQVERFIAQQITQRIAGFLQGLIPGLGGGEGAGLVTAELALTTAGTTLTKSGFSLATAGVGLNAAAAALTAAAGTLSAGGVGGFLGGIFGMQHGGTILRPMLAKIAEAGRPEMVLPLPRGLRPEDIARAVQSGSGGDTFNVTINNPSVRDDDDLRQIRYQAARGVADAMRLARRGNHPAFREGR